MSTNFVSLVVDRFVIYATVLVSAVASILDDTTLLQASWTSKTASIQVMEHAFADPFAKACVLYFEYSVVGFQASQPSDRVWIVGSCRVGSSVGRELLEACG